MKNILKSGILLVGLTACSMGLSAQSKGVRMLWEDTRVAGMEFTVKPLVYGWHYTRLHCWNREVEHEFLAMTGTEMLVTYRFNQAFSAGAGIGVRTYKVGLDDYIDHPLYLSGRFNFREYKRCSPYVGLDLGYGNVSGYIPGNSPLRKFCFNPSVGLDFPCRRVGKGFLEARLFVYGDVRSVGLDLTAGFTFQTGKMFR